MPDPLQLDNPERFRNTGIWRAVVMRLRKDDFEESRNFTINSPEPNRCGAIGIRIFIVADKEMPDPL
jgi:hypothetical protein